MAESFSGQFDGIKIFSATMMAGRDQLGERVTEFIQKNLGAITIAEVIVTQSSDTEFHCITLTVFYKGTPRWMPPAQQAPPRRS